MWILYFNESSTLRNCESVQILLNWQVWSQRRDQDNQPAICQVWSQRRDQDNQPAICQVSFDGQWCLLASALCQSRGNGVNIQVQLHRQLHQWCKLHRQLHQWCLCCVISWFPGEQLETEEYSGLCNWLWTSYFIISSYIVLEIMVGFGLHRAKRPKRHNDSIRRWMTTIMKSASFRLFFWTSLKLEHLTLFREFPLFRTSHRGREALKAP